MQKKPASEEKVAVSSAGEQEVEGSNMEGGMKSADPESGDDYDDEGDSDWEPEAGPHLWEHGLIESFNKKGGRNGGKKGSGVKGKGGGGRGGSKKQPTSNNNSKRGKKSDGPEGGVAFGPRETPLKEREQEAQRARLAT